MATKQISVADYISGVIGLSGKSQRQIAAEIGYDNPNMITMLKQGRTQVPLNKVKLLAKSLNLDPVHLLRMVMLEKTPEVWEIIEDIIGRDSTISQTELGLIEFSRSQLHGVDLDLHDHQLIDDLGNAFSAYANRQKAELARGSKEVKRGPKAAS
ncbi:helix-turn-helix transcriptional regulator [Burkholderia cepacia]|uniref:helix-turn-helix transcriptional regulator n=1 Tax=Burkholderia cepacia TaxID=292 RepID=UPI00157533EE|nr:helix-turn-helix transcriptional regulator [Burkholderia cepacia]